MDLWEKWEYIADKEMYAFGIGCIDAPSNLFFGRNEAGDNVDPSLYIRVFYVI